MRVLVAAPYPPAPDEAAAVALRTVERLIGEGHDVEVVSPLPSAADRFGPLAGWRGAWFLARNARAFDALHLVVSRRILFQPELAQGRRILDSVLLAAALRRWRTSSADLGDLSDVPGGGGGVSGKLIWRTIGTILVSDELVRNHAVKVLGFPVGRVVVQASPGRRKVPGAGAQLSATTARLPVTAGSSLPPWAAKAPPDWDAVMAEVRSRAAAERAAASGAGGPDLA